VEETGNGAILRHCRAIFDSGTVSGLDDGQLLERYRAWGGEAGELAFAALVTRHGPMVLRACRAALKDEHDAHDAFQATFLVLARRARSLWVRDSLAPWLHGVAVRVSSCARSAAARRKGHERRAAELATGRGGVEPGGDDIGPAIHEEIGRLPERYRAAIVLCDLQGMTHQQAAQQLRWPVGTVKSRQARGRQRLRDRLTRRGLAPAVGASGVLFAVEGASASVPAALVAASARAASRLAAGELMAGVVSAPVGALLERVVREMVMSKLKWAATGLLALGFATAGASALARQISGPGAEAPPVKEAEVTAPPAPVAPDAAVARLLKEQLASAQSLWDLTAHLHESGEIAIDRPCRASRRLMEARRELDGSRDGRIVAAREHLARIDALRVREEARLKAGTGSSIDVAEVNDEQVRAKLALARAVASREDVVDAQAVAAGEHPRNKAILAKLDDPISLPFESPTPLEDIIKYIKQATAGPQDSGIPMYVDPVGLKDAKATMKSTININLEGVPLRTSMRLMLSQLGLSYVVKDGLLIISRKGSPELEEAASK